MNEQDKLNERYDLTRGALERRGWFLHSTPSETVWVNKRTHGTVSTGARLKVLPEGSGKRAMELEWFVHENHSRMMPVSNKHKVMDAANRHWATKAYQKKNDKGDRLQGLVKTHEGGKV